MRDWSLGFNCPRTGVPAFSTAFSISRFWLLAGSRKIVCMQDPWYHEGLRFRCTQCGHCCTGAPGFVWLNDEEIEALADFQGVPRMQAEQVWTRRVGLKRSLREKGNGDCIFYDKSAGCTIYPVRPRQCRT